MKSPEEIFEEEWQRLKDILETEVLDKCPGSGAVAVALMMSEICLDKSEHLGTNWQSAMAAKAWENASRVFELAANKLAAIFNEQNFTKGA